MALLLVWLADMTMAEALALSLEEAAIWLECAVEMERELRPC
jgi:hypothetical protein